MGWCARDELRASGGNINALKGRTPRARRCRRSGLFEGPESEWLIREAGRALTIGAPAVCSIWI